MFPFSCQISLSSVRCALPIPILHLRNRLLLYVSLQRIATFDSCSFFNRSNLSSSLQKHRIVFANLLSHPNLEVSLKSLKLVLSCHKPQPDKVSTLMKLCNNSVGFFYKLLHTLANQHGSKIDGKASQHRSPRMGEVGGFKFP